MPPASILGPRARSVERGGAVRHGRPPNERMTEQATIQERVPTQVQHFLLERLDEDILLYHPGMTKTIRLNETASLVWDLCDGTRSVREIAVLLSETCPEDAPQILEDIETTLRRFAEEGAVEFA